MKLTTFLDKTDLERSLLIGYYGGGNYGDELLLEVLQNMLHKRSVRQVAIAYQYPKTFTSMHNDFGYRLVDMHSKGALLGQALRSKSILVGGGGLWGVDMNTSTFMLSVFLFACRWLFGKKVYLLGVGYYSSTTWLGRAGAWLAGKSATLLLARDSETYANFSHIAKHLVQDRDLAWYIPELDLTTYDTAAALLQNKVQLRDDKTLFLVPRRMQAKKQQGTFSRFNELLAECVEANPDKKIIIALAESKTKGPELFAWANSLKAGRKNVAVLDAAYNPLALFAFFQKHHEQLVLIAPQLHLIHTAHLTDTPYAPIVYDNKVRALLSKIGVPSALQLPITEVTGAELQRFIDDQWGGAV